METAKPESLKGYVVPVGLVVLGVTAWRRFFGTPGRDAFLKCAILGSPSLWSRIVGDYTLPAPAAADFAWLRHNGDKVQQAVTNFQEARGILVDQDSRAVGAVQAMPNPAALAYFALWYAKRSEGATPLSEGVEFLSDNAMGMIADHVRRVGGLNPYGLTI